MTQKPVYSTDPKQSVATGKDSRKVGDKKIENIFEKGTGPVKMRLETGGRAGKSVTVLSNLPFAEDEAQKLMKTMQSQFGCGATLKNSCIELRGDVRQKVDAFFQGKGWKLIKVG